MSVKFLEEFATGSMIMLNCFCGHVTFRTADCCGINLV
jgi:hypothetical protein